MFKKILQTISFVLIVALLAGMLPMQVFAEEFRSSLSATDNVTLVTGQPQILSEVKSGRSKYAKEFLLSDGLHMAVVYGGAVHYEKDGKWEDIDNTLVAHTDGTYRNTAGLWDVSFPQQFGNNQAVTITKDGYTLSFGLPQKVAAVPGLEVMSAGTAEPLATTQAATVTAQVETTVDVSEAKASTDHPETVLDKLSSRMTYANVHTGTDVVYDLQNNTVKESVILASYDASLRGYRYALSTGDLIPVLQENGSILFYDKTQTNVVMAMESPYLLDAAMESSRDIEVSLTGENGKYVLSYTLPLSWLSAQERQWPVILDPEVVGDLSRSNIDDVLIYSNGRNRHADGFLDVGYETTVGQKRSYVRYIELPQLRSADTVVSASIYMWQMYYRSVSIPAEVHKVTGDWVVDTIDWNSQPTYDETIVDFVRGHNAVKYGWDITEIVQDWYTTGENYGLLFKTSDSIENTSTSNKFRQFYSSDYGYELRPTLEIIFRNTSGLEGHWDYSSASAGRAGTGYVNNYTGNLVWVRGDIGFGGNRMPVNISHIYNANDADNNKSGMGYGWRTNFNQTIEPWPGEDDTFTVEGGKEYYEWVDSDGTSHYFEETSDSTIFKDEEGMGLTLKITGTGDATVYTITDKKDNISYFDATGRLYKQENNQEVKSSIQITYTAAGSHLISTITDGAGRVYNFQYNTDGLLTRISYTGTGTTELSHVAFAYTDGALTAITDKDGKSSLFTYTQMPGATATDPNRRILLTAQDVDDYRLSYTYYAEDSGFAPARVATVQETDGTALGSKLSFSYGQNQTILTSSHPDSNGTYHADNSLTYQFNDYGNTISVQDEEGRAQYSQLGWDNSTTGAKGNQLALSSKLQNTVVNLLYDSSFENSTLWTPDLSTPTMTYSIATGGYLGSKAMKISGCSAEFLCSPTFTVGAGESYTFSGYVKTTAGSAKLGIRNSNVQEDAVYSDAVSTGGEWVRVQVSYTNNTQSAKTMYACFMGLDSATAYIDCVQLEQAPTASRYNLVNNSDFRNGTTGWTLYSTGAIATVDPAAPQLEGSAYRISGNYTSTYTITQTIPVSGSAGDSFVFSGWAKGRTAALDGLINGMDKEYALQFTFNNTNGTTTVKTVSFNHNIDDWQYVAAAAVATRAYSSVKIQARYVANANPVYFDGIQVYKEEYGTSYTYDTTTGNVTSVVDLQKQTTTYEYTDNDLTKATLPSGAVLTYDYDDYHNVIEATSAEGMLYEFEYDDYGNNTSVSIVGGGKKITSTANYTNNGNYLSSVTDALGNSTTYSYNADTGVLEWVKSPKDSEATRTNYTYDEMYRVASAAAATDTGENMSASYTYTDDYLTKIQTPTTTYNFTYGDFGLRTSVKVGTQNLATYTYDDQKRLNRLDYGNNDRVEYTYDEQSRLVKETYEDGSTVSYAYDNTGALATVTDSATGITTTYYYDLINRLVKYEEKGTNRSHSVTYTYDEKNNLSSYTEVIDGVSTTYAYTYDDDNRVTSMTVGNTTVAYTYDDFGRMSQQVTKHGDTVVLTENATFKDSSDTASSGQITSYNGFDYTYDANGNITSVTYNGETTTYEYDSMNQLIRENNQEWNKTQTWTYDNAGNIQSRTEYAYTTADLSTVTPTKTVTYDYDNENWGDLLTGYDGKTFTYDEIGNLTSDGTRTYAWNHGRQLTSTTQGSTVWNYTYDSNGLRTKRTNGNGLTYEYTYNGSQLTKMSVMGLDYYFTYDISGTPLTVSFKNNLYFYSTNLQGDVVAIRDINGETIVSYSYDAWGNYGHFFDSGFDYSFIYFQPLRYRGYVYDVETGLYYLQSRYYNPQTGRFINGDGLVQTGQGFVGNNMFAYCLNNPVIFADDAGTAAHLVTIEFFDDGGGGGGEDDESGKNIENMLKFFGVNNKCDLPDLPDNCMVFIENTKSLTFGPVTIVYGITVVMDKDKYCTYNFVGLSKSASILPIPIDGSVTQGYVYNVNDPSDYSGLFFGSSINGMYDIQGGAVAPNGVYATIITGRSFLASYGGSITNYWSTSDEWTYGLAPIKYITWPNPGSINIQEI